MADLKIWSSRASSTLLGIALLLSSILVEAGPAPAQVQTFEVLQPRQFEILRSHAQAFIDAKERTGFALDAGEAPGAWFHVRYQGRAVMAVENTPAGLVISLPARVELLAPDALQLRDEFRIWLEHGERLWAEEQSSKLDSTRPGPGVGKVQCPAPRASARLRRPSTGAAHHGSGLVPSNPASSESTGRQLGH